MFFIIINQSIWYNKWVKKVSFKFNESNLNIHDELLKEELNNIGIWILKHECIVDRIYDNYVGAFQSEALRGEAGWKCILCPTCFYVSL